MKRKHALDLKTCDLCEEQFKTVREMKLHRHTHSFNGCYGSKYRCEECEFVSDDIETMEVHIGKCCYTYFECGLCEYRPESLEKLELHL